MWSIQKNLYGKLFSILVLSSITSLSVSFAEIKVEEVKPDQKKDQGRDSAVPPPLVPAERVDRESPPSLIPAAAVEAVNEVKNPERSDMVIDRLATLAFHLLSQTRRVQVNVETLRASSHYVKAEPEDKFAFRPILVEPGLKPKEWVEFDVVNKVLNKIYAFDGLVDRLYNMTQAAAGYASRTGDDWATLKTQEPFVEIQKNLNVLAAENDPFTVMYNAIDEYITLAENTMKRNPRVPAAAMKRAIAQLGNSAIVNKKRKRVGQSMNHLDNIVSDLIKIYVKPEENPNYKPLFKTDEWDSFLGHKGVY